ncbi:MAG: glutamine-hydrolyzing carbamoyl-phosphate synthase small subunit [Alphaproteobacteria bacterium]|jgi:carbamoyl-phosphate synthase small subunit|nr:glutamine-hydrolyzing carbamoyl-phosphate synthase small subunit [Alphaproteobacteria bacterium]
MTTCPPPTCKLALVDGTVFTGRAFGCTEAPQPIGGEVVFNTALTGYQEILTDPSYSGQIVTMTYPLIGNYGVNPEDLESSRVQVAGLVVRELARLPHNYRATLRLEDWLAEQGVLGIEGIDTRALTRKLRIEGAMNGVISCSELDDQKLVEAAGALPAMSGCNLARVVSPTERSDWTDGLGQWLPIQGIPAGRDRAFRVVAIDCGAKHNILRNLVDRGCEVIVVPHDATPEDILGLEPDGLFVSNGPGDPDPVTPTIEALRRIDGSVPTFGICLGHQLLGLAMGAGRFKLKFGHRGANQPVQNLATKKVEITSQNHGFGIDIDTLRQAGGEPTHVNLNDGTLEGFRHPDKPIFAVQYHPEASPGPHDAGYLFDCFVEMMKTGHSPTAERMDHAQKTRNQVG